jgi:hypothetical protein
VTGLCQANPTRKLAEFAPVREQCSPLHWPTQDAPRDSTGPATTSVVRWVTLNQQQQFCGVALLAELACHFKRNPATKTVP